MSKARSMGTDVTRADAHRAEQATAKTEDGKTADEGEEPSEAVSEQDTPVENEG